MTTRISLESARGGKSRGSLGCSSAARKWNNSDVNISWSSQEKIWVNSMFLRSLGCFANEVFGTKECLDCRVVWGRVWHKL